MAIAKKCDRCGKFHEIYNKNDDSSNINSLVTANADEYNKRYNQKLINLCPDCKDSFLNWLKKR
ncbi:hypothetical protein ACTP1G_00770 [Streptococcus milleri]